ncbi:MULTISPECIES: regulatory protein RecX [unclassified Microbacterium]|uniref:regulatory protein RecX n=1 Tax=unclassified Microbacterium TaxID=2609290 RepID=UPI00301600C0
MSGEDGAIAPVIPLFAGAVPVDGDHDARIDEAGGPSWHTTWTGSPAPAVETPADADVAERVDAAEAALLRKLRTRSLSVREARSVLIGQEIDETSADAVIARFVDHGYLDDAKLAEQLIHTAVDRKGQGRMAVSRALSQRGIPREVADAAIDELPDDERERALAFARTKAPAMRTLERDVALRRLSGQLARRGYGAYALDAARTALEEAARPPRGVVRFE